MSLPSTSNRSMHAPPPAVVGHLVANAGCRARVLSAHSYRPTKHRKRTLVQAIVQEEVTSRTSPGPCFTSPICCHRPACTRHVSMSLMLHTRSTFSVTDKHWLRMFTGCSEGFLVYTVQEQVDLDTSVDAVKRKMIDAAGAGKSFTSPGWLTQLGRLWGGKSVRRNMCFTWCRSLQPPVQQSTRHKSVSPAAQLQSVSCATTVLCCRTHQLQMQSQMTSKTCLVALCSKHCSSGCRSQALCTFCPQVTRGSFCHALHYMQHDMPDVLNSQRACTIAPYDLCARQKQIKQCTATQPNCYLLLVMSAL